MKQTPFAWLRSLLSGNLFQPKQPEKTPEQLQQERLSQLETESSIKLVRGDVLVVPEGLPDDSPEILLAEMQLAPVIEVKGLSNMAVIKSW